MPVICLMFDCPVCLYLYLAFGSHENNGSMSRTGCEQAKQFSIADKSKSPLQAVIHSAQHFQVIPEPFHHPVARTVLEGG